MKKLLGLLLVASGLALADDPKTPAQVAAEIDGLKVAKPAWREIPWRSCLLEGIARARSEKKPLLLWVFIDRPVDDARC